ncbi:hypothetical protein EHV15_35305 [Paenibacillus oralis]|uniref:Uncharacterized protein n=1 Tax=Paenibacillus oralis TaxID=2490856 RepID=A0A3P3TEI3_9BACL|nr:hypothetical protein [Paenibacillus oralis]RRJ54843.1 hypothetical protein EHV15_35305 [Paenibacillus oralis]
MIEFIVINKGKALPQFNGLRGKAKFSREMIDVVLDNGFKTCVHHSNLLKFYEVVDQNEFLAARTQWEQDGPSGRMQ